MSKAKKAIKVDLGAATAALKKTAEAGRGHNGETTEDVRSKIAHAKAKVARVSGPQGELLRKVQQASRIQVKDLGATDNKSVKALVKHELLELNGTVAGQPYVELSEAGKLYLNLKAPAKAAKAEKSTQPKKTAVKKAPVKLAEKLAKVVLAKAKAKAAKKSKAAPEKKTAAKKAAPVKTVKAPTKKTAPAKKTRKKAAAPAKAPAKKAAAKGAKATQQRFDDLLSQAPAREKPSRKKNETPRAFRDPRMPPVGTILESVYLVKGKRIKVEICEGYIKPRCKKPDGSSFLRTKYNSLSALMREARDLNSNGWIWFGLGEYRNGELINVAKNKAAQKGDQS